MSIMENEKSAMAQAIAQSTIIDETPQSVSEREKKVMEEKTDLRTQRTYKLLTNALIAMLSEQHFEDITVRDLCARAMVRPATFYKHFGDKYELFTFLVKEMQREFREESQIKRDSKRPQTYYVGIIERTLNFLEQNKAMVTSVVNSTASPILIDLMSDQIEHEVLIEFKADEKRGAIMPGKPDLMAPLFTGALIYTAKWWVLHDWHTPKDEIVAECVKILKLM